MRISDWSSDVCSSDLVIHESMFGVAFPGTSGTFDADPWFWILRGTPTLPTTPATPQAPTLPTEASTRADTAVSAAMQREAPLPADGTEMQDAQQPQTAVDAQVKGATHAQAHSEVATRIGRASCRERVCQYV